MRRAKLGNMFGRLLASGWINQLQAQTPSQTACAKVGKLFQESCQPKSEVGKLFQESCQPQRAPEDTIISQRAAVMPSLRLPANRNSQREADSAWRPNDTLFPFSSHQTVTPIAPVRR